MLHTRMSISDIMCTNASYKYDVTISDVHIEPFWGIVDTLGVQRLVWFGCKKQIDKNLKLLCVQLIFKLLFLYCLYCACSSAIQPIGCHTAHSFLKTIKTNNIVSTLLEMA